MENAVIKTNNSQIRLKNLIIYLDEIIGIAMAEKEAE
jgi:hypothetical protein